MGWKQVDIDLGREASILHTILSTQLKSLKLSDSARHTIAPLVNILDAITRAGGEEEGDQLTSTIEALRAMQSDMFGAATITAKSGDDSESSSEYTTPAQSQATSPLHEQSPPPAGASIQEARNTVTSAARLMAMQNSTNASTTGTGTGEAQQQAHHHHHHQGGGGGGGGGGTASSPSTSPTHGEKVSTLATHSKSAYPPQNKSHTLQERGGASHHASELGARRKSDSEIQRHRVRPASQQLPVNPSENSRQFHTRSIDFSVR